MTELLIALGVAVWVVGGYFFTCYWMRYSKDSNPVVIHFFSPVLMAGVGLATVCQGIAWAYKVVRKKTLRFYGVED